MSKHESLRSNKLKRAALAVLVGATSLTGCAPKAEVPTPAPSASEPSNPGEQTPTPTEATPSATPSVSESPAPSVEVTKTREQLIAEYQIEAGLSPREFAEAYLDRLEAQTLAGGSAEYYNKLWNDPNLGVSDILAENRSKAEEQSDIFTEALYVPDWQEHEALVTVQKKMVERNANYLYLDAANFIQGTGTIWVELELISAAISSETGDQRTIVMKGIEKNNAAEMGSDPIDAASANNSEFELVVTAVTLGDIERISYIDSKTQ